MSSAGLDDPRHEAAGLSPAHAPDFVGKTEGKDAVCLVRMLLEHLEVGDSVKGILTAGDPDLARPQSVDVDREGARIQGLLNTVGEVSLLLACPLEQLEGDLSLGRRTEDDGAREDFRVGNRIGVFFSPVENGIGVFFFPVANGIGVFFPVENDPDRLGALIGAVHADRHFLVPFARPYLGKVKLTLFNRIVKYRYYKRAPIELFWLKKFFIDRN